MRAQNPFGSPKREFSRSSTKRELGKFSPIAERAKARPAVNKFYDVSKLMQSDERKKVMLASGKERKPREPKYDDDLYNSLMNILLNHKKTIRPYNIYTKEQADKFAKARGYRAFEEDLDGDKIPDVYITNKKGQPIIINGYGLDDSLYPHKRDYHMGGRLVDIDGDGTPDARGSFKEYLKGQWRYVESDEPWEDNYVSPEPNDKVIEYVKKGYGTVRKPRKQLSPYQMFLKMNSQSLKMALWEEGMDGISKVLKPMQLINLLYQYYVVWGYAGSKLHTTNWSVIEEHLKSKAGKKRFRDWFINMAQTNGPLTKENILNLFWVTIPKAGDVPLINYIFQDVGGADNVIEVVNVLKSYDDAGMKPSQKRESRMSKTESRLIIEQMADAVAERVRQLVDIIKTGDSETSELLHSAISSPSQIYQSPRRGQGNVTPRGPIVQQIEEEDEE